MKFNSAKTVLLTIAIEKLSIGYGLLSFKKGWTSFANTGTITVFRHRKIKLYQPEHLPDRCGL